LCFLVPLLIFKAVFWESETVIVIIIMIIVEVAVVVVVELDSLKKNDKHPVVREKVEEFRNEFWATNFYSPYNKGGNGVILSSI
jgi:nitrate/nitrite transporter NarK